MPHPAHICHAANMIRLSHNRAFAFLISLAFACALALNVATAHAQTTPGPLPQPAGYVNDFAGVIDAATKQRLENILANLKQHADIEFAIATVKTTGEQDIFDYSLQVARNWGTGSRTSKKKSLLLLVAVDNGKYFTQISRGIEGDLPDGLVGDMGQRLREPLRAGNYGAGLMTAVRAFVAAIAEKRGFSVDDIEQATKDQQTAEAQPPRAGGETKEAPAREPAAEVAAVPKKEVAKPPSPASVDETEKNELDATLALAASERIEKLKAFIDAHPQSALKEYASELIVSSRATLGDEKLKAGDAAGGIEQFRLAVTGSPANLSDQLFAGVISQLPLNLFMRGEHAAAIETARLIESKVKDDPKRLLAITAFYLSIEAPDEAARVAEIVIKLAPEMAAAHQALAAARHIGLQLDAAAAEYARAVELDPKSASAHRSLADLRRAGGKTEEALTLYREGLKIDPADKAARAGEVLALFDMGKKDEAEARLEAALKDEPRNLPLLVGAAYWYAAHNGNARALELAERAVVIEPRYTWANIALARALVADKRPLDAERVLRFVRQYGNFPTLDYELASALASAGLYAEAADELAHSFTLKDGQIETLLAGRSPARAESFIELLAPERRASIFQATAADSEANARMLKGLLAFTVAMNPAGGREAIKEADAVAAAQEFVGGEDRMRTFRQLYAAVRLLQSNIALPAVLNLTDAAAGGVEAALDTPAPNVATLADELRDIRAQAIAAGATPLIPEVQRTVLSNILRGRIEDIAGWALFNRDNTAEALVRLKRASSVLPENTIWSRTALWHLGVALDAAGNQQEALAAYIKSYNSGQPDTIRRAVIERLYRKVNGSVDGLDAKIGPSVSSDIKDSTDAAQQGVTPASNTAEGPKGSDNTAPVNTVTPTPASSPSSTPQAPLAAPEPKPSQSPPSLPASLPAPSTDNAPQTSAPASEQQKTESTEKKRPDREEL